MKGTQVMILAAGLGTRMNSSLPKVLHNFDGKPIISRIITSVKDAGLDDIVIVVGYGGEIVEERVKKDFPDIDFNFVKQKLLKGSGRAVFEALPKVKSEYLVILSGDVPLIKSKTINKLIQTVKKSQSEGAVLTCFVEDPKEYGRIIRNDKYVKEIVEASELDSNQKNIKEVNTGIYVFKTSILSKAILKLKPSGPKKEYYLTDVVKYINNLGGKIEAVNINDVLEITGPNSKRELVELEKSYYIRNAYDLQEKGVIIKDPLNVYISQEVEVGVDTIIYPGTYINGDTKIGCRCIIGPSVIISDSVIEDDCEIKPFTVISSSKIRKKTSVGPFSHIRPESDIGPNAKIGNFSEIKKSKIDEGSKVPHLSYIGDSEIGKMVNIGAGTITCNYDGKMKHKTIIKDGAFIGSNTNLVAPVVIGKETLIGAGSTITDDVPDGKLAIARERQVIKDRKKL